MTVKTTPAKSIIIKAPARQKFEPEELTRIIGEVLASINCLACFSGYDISFVNEVQLGIDADLNLVPATVELSA
jgi:hypothetical protein